MLIMQEGSQEINKHGEIFKKKELLKEGARTIHSKFDEFKDMAFSIFRLVYIRGQGRIFCEHW